MKSSSLFKLLVLATGIIHLTIATACAFPNIASMNVQKNSHFRFKHLIENERRLGNFLIPKKIISWHYNGNHGEFLLAEVKATNNSSCVIYIIDNAEFILLGGNNDCRWKNNPELIKHENKAWIEFRPTMKMASPPAAATNEFTAHFRKDTKGICILGLPSNSYKLLRCPDDAAPDSR